MSGWQDAQERFSDMGVPSVSHFSDRSMKAYKAFELGRATLGMIFHPVAVFRALWLAISRGYSVGYAGGDCFQMPGVLLLHGGDVGDKVTPRPGCGKV